MALDLLRGLAMVILIVNHLPVHSPLDRAAGALLSAAEVLVAVSGIVVGMVFGRRWLAQGGRATTAALLRRSRKLYVASVAVVALVWALTAVPGLATDALTVSHAVQPPLDLYAYDGTLRTALAVVTLEAGPWQFTILAFFIAAIAAAPSVLWGLARGWWPAVLGLSWTLYALGRAWPVDVLPSQSERPFPLLVWQLLFVHGAVLGWHRSGVARALRRLGGAPVTVVVAAAGAAVWLQLHGHALLGEGWRAEHFDKSSLDLARVATMASLGAAAYVLLTHPWAEPALGRVLLPLGRNSFYVFIVHVFVCLAVASLAGDGLGPAGNAAVQVGAVGVLVAMVRWRVLFRWIPR